MRFSLFLFLATLIAGAQQTPNPNPVRSSPWFNAQTVDFAALTSGPPAPGSELDRQDMKEVLQAQRTRTPAQIQEAQADDKEEDIFIFASVLGPRFNAAELPVTTAFSQRLREASAVINPRLKVRFGRPRPFVASTEVHPVCNKTASNSFPSGHSMVGTLEAFALTQIVPEYSSEILSRLDQYMRDRIVCGVHYPSDIAASRMIASSLFGLIAASPAFQQELAAARKEVRAHLGLPDTPALVPGYLADNTVLIVRHAEKPPESTGQRGLSKVGQHRAEAYISYLRPFLEGGMRLNISALYAAADSPSSVRPRLTLTPLSKASGIPLDTSVSSKDPKSLVAWLRTHPHGNTPLICWRHGQIPALLSALGTAPDLLLPAGKWPDDVYDLVLVLHFDAQGRLKSQKLLHESLQID